MINRLSFSDQFFSEALPLLENITMEQYRSRPDMIPMIFNVGSSNQWGEQDSEVTGFGLIPQSSEGADVEYDDVYQGLSKTYTHLLFKGGYKITKESVDDGKFGMHKKLAVAHGRAMFNTRQIEAASVFNNGFDPSFTGPDLVELFATNHPLQGPDGGTYRNELSTSADLSLTSLRQALNDVQDLVDDRGLLIHITSKWLLIPHELRYDAQELLKSELRPGTANNDINAFQMDQLNWIQWNYLTDPDAWFLLPDKDEHSLRWIEREPVNISSDYDFDSSTSKTQIRNRFSYGWSSPRGPFGSPGA